MELIRQAAGLPVAALFPLAIPALRRRWPLASFVTLLYALYVMLPVIDEPRSWLAVVLTVNAGVAVHFLTERLANSDKKSDAGDVNHAPDDLRPEPARVRRGANRLSLIPIAAIATLTLLPVLRNVVALCGVPAGKPGRPSKSLTLDAAKALLSAAEDSRLYAYVVLSLLTGARTEELRALTWSRVDLDGRPDDDDPVPPSVQVWHSVREGGATPRLASPGVPSPYLSGP